MHWYAEALAAKAVCFEKIFNIQTLYGAIVPGQLLANPSITIATFQALRLTRKVELIGLKTEEKMALGVDDQGPIKNKTGTTGPFSATSFAGIPREFNKDLLTATRDDLKILADRLEGMKAPETKGRGDTLDTIIECLRLGKLKTAARIFVIDGDKIRSPQDYGNAREELDRQFGATGAILDALKD